MKRETLNSLFIVLLAASLSAAHAQVDQDNVKTEVIKVGYYNELYGHIHQNPSKYSTSLTNISCGHPLKVLSVKSKSGVRSLFNGEWNYIAAGPYEGYVKEGFISSSRPKCLQDKYPKFFEKLSLDITNMYYWGKLYDQMVSGKTKAR